MIRPIACALALVSAVASAPAAEWETVESKDGGFTVQMPGKLTVNKTRTEKGAGGDVKTLVLGCAGNGGLYIAYKVTLPTRIVKGTEDAELDAERNGMAKEWNGRVTGERKIKAGDKVGRDFTIRGTPPKQSDTLTIRMREYLADDAVYIVAVVSLPNRELPEDTGRFLGSLAIGGVRAAGTPTAEPKGTDVPGWGEAIDAPRDAEFVPVKNGLQVNVTGTPKPKDDQPGLSLPRVMRDVDGDFTVSVKVAGEFKPGGRSTHPKSAPWNGAGIIIYSDAENFIRVERAAVNRGGKVYPYVNFEEFEGASVAAAHNEVMKGGDCWVRVERKGSRIQAGISFDGTNWKDLKPIQTVWPAKLKVGVCASSSSSLPFSVTFEDFQFKANPK